MSAILSNTAEMLAAAHEAAKVEAHKAAQGVLDRHFGGEDGGACGFAWATFYPTAKGNTKIGKAERAAIEAIGFRKDYTGKAWQLWNPADHRCQSVDAKFAGAQAYAKHFEAATGVSLSYGDRLD